MRRIKCILCLGHCIASSASATAQKSYTVLRAASLIAFRSDLSYVTKACKATAPKEHLFVSSVSETSVTYDHVRLFLRYARCIMKPEARTDLMFCFVLIILLENNKPQHPSAYQATWNTASSQTLGKLQIGTASFNTAKTSLPGSYLPSCVAIGAPFDPFHGNLN